MGEGFFIGHWLLYIGYCCNLVAVQVRSGQGWFEVGIGACGAGCGEDIIFGGNEK